MARVPISCYGVFKKHRGFANLKFFNQETWTYMNNIITPTPNQPPRPRLAPPPHPSRDGVTVYQVLEAKTQVATNKFTWQMQLACRYRNVYAPEKQRGSPKNHPIEIRKIIWTKPPCLGSMLIFQGVSGALYLMQYENAYMG